MGRRKTTILKDKETLFEESLSKSGVFLYKSNKIEFCKKKEMFCKEITLKGCKNSTIRLEKE